MAVPFIGLYQWGGHAVYCDLRFKKAFFRFCNKKKVLLNDQGEHYTVKYLHYMITKTDFFGCVCKVILPCQ